MLLRCWSRMSWVSWSALLRRINTATRAAAASATSMKAMISFR